MLRPQRLSLRKGVKADRRRESLGLRPQDLKRQEFYRNVQIQNSYWAKHQAKSYSIDGLRLSVSLISKFDRLQSFLDADRQDQRLPCHEESKWGQLSQL